MTTFSASKRHELKEYDDLSCFNLPLFFNSAMFSRSEKTVPFEHNLDHTLSFTTVQCRHTTLVLSSHVPLSAMSGETHSVMKLSLL